MKFLVSLVLAAATANSVPAGDPTSAAICVLKTHRVLSVTPYFEDVHMGSGATTQRLRGASLFVLAEPGLTAEWLRLTLQRHLAEMRTTTMRDCPLEVKDVTVTVESAGPGFAVKLIARDADQADEILRRAQLLIG